ncbi:MAG: hypothetical protein M4579_000963 [Chaenotheca gracillima]|nr:MAG: hypothetical protein M4579_000963 [Chaenotheca gracillima]
MPCKRCDVALLYHIITTAQQLPQAAQLPFRALFSAYETVLRQNGVDPDGDSVYFRFLLKLGGVRGGATLYEKFETLLERLGIEIEIESGSRNDDAASSSDLQSIQLPTTPREKSRRASFSSFYDATGEFTQVSPRRARSQSPIPRARNYFAARKDDRSSKKHTSSETEETEPLNIGQPKKPTIVRGRVTSQGSLPSLQIYGAKESYGSRQRPPSITQESDVRNRPAEVPRPLRKYSADTLPQADFIPRPSAQTLEYGPGPPAPAISQEPRFRPSDTQLIEDAEFLYSRRLNSIMRDCFHQWHGRALQSHPYHRNLEYTAVKHDHRILLTQALETWRAHCRHKRRQAETRRFYAQQEQRADRARDLFLLTKAFTHWAQCASEEVQRTSTARRHILRTKYFHAWKDITAVNELKVRRFCLRKFFTQWKERSRTATALATLACRQEEMILVQKFYWAWFWKFCENRAPGWLAGRILETHFSKWREVRIQRHEKEAWVEKFRRRNTLEIFLRKWSERTRGFQTRQREVEESRMKELSEKYWRFWRKQAQLAPVAREVSDNVDWRIASQALRTWIIRTRMEAQAAKINQQRISRNMWTAWNDRLRWQTIAQRIDERVVLQNLYRWLLAERQTVLRRHFDQRLKQRILTTVVSKWRMKQSELSLCEELVAFNRSTRIMKAILSRWGLQLELQRQRDQLAAEIFFPRLLQTAFDDWTGRLRHVRSLERNAFSAHYYFSTTTTLRKWQSAAEASRREKRRTAYSQVRRLLKMNLAQRSLSTWRAKTAHYNDLNSQAQTAHQNHILVVGLGFFDSWRARSAELTEAIADAKSTRDMSLSRHCLSQWRSQMRTQTELETLAAYRSELHVLNQAATLLRRLGMLAFQHSNRDKSAENLRVRNERKHYRNIIRHWLERTEQKRGKQLADGRSRLITERTTGEGDTSVTGAKAVLAAEDWTTFDDAFDVTDWYPAAEASSNATPLPGYLSTPSKRAVRAKALVKLSLATPKTPLVRPFQQRLRSHYSAERAGAAGASGNRSFKGSIFGERPPQTTIDRISEGSSSPLEGRDDGDG